MQKVTVKTSDNSGTNGKLINLTASSVPLTVSRHLLGRSAIWL
jgi:hypothetical protein